MAGPFYKTDYKGNEKLAKICKKCMYYDAEDDSCLFVFCIKFSEYAKEMDGDDEQPDISYSMG